MSTTATNTEKEDKKPINLSNQKIEAFQPIFKNTITDQPIDGLTEEKYQELLVEKHPLTNIERI